MKAILFDLDGVLYNDEQPIPGAAGRNRLDPLAKYSSFVCDQHVVTWPGQRWSRNFSRFGIPAAR